MTNIESGILNLSSLLETEDENSIQNRFIDINLIREDENQPRIEFDKESMAELTKSVSERGVKTPISIRKNPDGAGYIVNHGARRLRAAKEAGLKEIPAFIDEDYIFLDQLVENIQRENLKPFEIAYTLNKLKNSGYKKIEIARMIGKSNAYVSQYMALLTMPDFIRKWIISGKINDVTVANELLRLYKKHGDEIITNVIDVGEISRQTIKELKDFYSDFESDNENMDSKSDDEFSLEETELSIDNNLKPVTEKEEEEIDKDILKINMTITYGGKKYPFVLNELENIKKILNLIDFYSIIEKS